MSNADRLAFVWLWVPEHLAFAIVDASSSTGRGKT
jgi:hypothetical protein